MTASPACPTFGSARSSGRGGPRVPTSIRSSGPCGGPWPAAANAGRGQLTRSRRDEGRDEDEEDLPLVLGSLWSLPLHPPVLEPDLDLALGRHRV